MTSTLEQHYLISANNDERSPKQIEQRCCTKYQLLIGKYDGLENFPCLGGQLK